MILVNPSAKVNKEIPNLQLAYIGTISNSKIIDLNTRPETADRFLDYQTDALATSVQSRTYGQAEKIAKLYKGKYPNSQVVSVSGIIDIECCYPFLKLEQDLSFNQPFDDDLPFPKYELFDSFEIFKKHWQIGDWPYVIMTSQGCPYQCIYCAARNRPWRARSIENCYQELKQAKEKYGIKTFQILDDCFNLKPERTIEFCHKIKGLNLSWYCSNGLRVNSFNEELAKIMAETGCKEVSFGIESIDNEILTNIRKGITSAQVEKAIKIAKKYFRFVNGFFIIGLPGSTYQKDLDTLHWTLRRGINAHFSYYLPFDKLMRLDETFYGKLSGPISDTYSKESQRRISELTEFMRGEPSGHSWKERALITGQAIFRYDLLYLPLYIKVGAKRLISKVKSKIWQ